MGALSLCDFCAVISSFPNRFPFADLRAMIFFRSLMLFSAPSSVAAVASAEISVSGWQVVNVVLSIVLIFLDNEMK